MSVIYREPNRQQKAAGRRSGLRRTNNPRLVVWGDTNFGRLPTATPPAAHAAENTVRPATLRCRVLIDEHCLKPHLLPYRSHPHTGLPYVCLSLRGAARPTYTAAYLVPPSVDVEVPHLDAACCERVVAHLRHAAGQHTHQAGLAHVWGANQGQCGQGWIHIGQAAQGARHLQRHSVTRGKAHTMKSTGALVSYS